MATRTAVSDELTQQLHIIRRHDEARASARYVVPLDEDVTRLEYLKKQSSLEIKIAQLSSRMDAVGAQIDPLSRLVDGCTNFVNTNPSFTFVGWPNVPKGTTLEGIRLKIAKLSDAIFDTQNALRPQTEAQDIIKSTVKFWAQSHTVSVSAAAEAGDGGGISALPLGIKNFEARHLHELLAWMFPEQLTAALSKELAQMYSSDALVLSDREKANNLAKLQDERLQAERIEESIVISLEAANQSVSRRDNASPAAVLGVQV
jgi:hypothetical protein